MNKSWKKFTIIISIMLAVVLVCTSWNVILFKITDSVAAQTSYTDNNVQNNVNNSNQQGTQQGANVQTNVTGVNGQQVTQVNGAPVTGNSSTGNSLNAGTANFAQPQASTVLGYSKAQIIAYYNTCLRSSYSQQRMTDRKTEKVSIGVDSVTINGGEKNEMVTNTANSIASKNQKNVDETKSFTRGTASDGTSAYTYVLPANLTASGAKSASISRNGSGYKVVINLVAESCGHNTKPPHNAACAWPLDIKDVASALDSFGEVTKAQFTYPGTTLTATIDASGRVNYVRVDMPLTVKDGTGVITFNFPGLKGMVITASAHGEWTCTHTMSF